MYLRTQTHASRLRGSYSALHGELSEARSAQERIREDQFNYVLKILAGNSLWQSYITKNLAAIKNNLPQRPFRVVDRREYVRTLTALGREDSGHIPGITDKSSGVITMVEFFGGGSNATYLGAALHEAVHLVSHPAGGSRAGQSTALATLGDGLFEGLVECVTDNILTTQGFTLANPKMRGHDDRVPVAKALISAFGVPLFARLLFEGVYQPFTHQMILTYSKDGWEEIKNLTKANNYKRALVRMKELSAIQQRIRMQRFSDTLFPVFGVIRSLSQR